MAPVHQRGPYRPNSDLVDVLNKTNGLHACGNEGLKGDIQLFLGEFDGLCVLGGEKSECMKNSDCDPGQMCWCAGVIAGARQPEGIWRQALGAEGQQDVGYVNRCLPLNCPDDCGGLGCAVTRDHCRRPIGFRCHTARDECGAEKMAFVLVRTIALSVFSKRMQVPGFVNKLPTAIRMHPRTRT